MSFFSEPTGEMADMALEPLEPEDDESLPEGLPPPAGGRQRGGRPPPQTSAEAGRHAARRTQRDPDAKPGSDFWDRIARGQNVTKIGGATNPRDVASQIAAQGRAAVDCPLLQCVGPQSTNQAMKAIAIARTYLRQSDASGSSTHPDIAVYPEFVKLDSAQGGGGGANDTLSAMQLVLSKRSRRTSVDKDGRQLKVGKDTDAKALAGAIASCTREGSRVELTAIGAASVNQAVKAVAIARQFVEEEAIDLCCRPEFVELSDDQLGDGTAGGPTSALRLLVLVQQT